MNSTWKSDEGYGAPYTLGIGELLIELWPLGTLASTYESWLTIICTRYMTASFNRPPIIQSEAPVPLPNPGLDQSGADPTLHPTLSPRYWSISLPGSWGKGIVLTDRTYKARSPVWKNGCCLYHQYSVLSTQTSVGTAVIHIYHFNVCNFTV